MEGSPGEPGPLDRALADQVERLAHDLRSPLSSIRITYELLSDPAALDSLQADPAHFRQLVQSFGRSVGRLERKVSDLLDASYLFAGRLTLDTTGVDPRAVTSEAVGQVSGEAAARNQSIEISAMDAAPSIVADPIRLRQVLVNLLLNAINYSPVGSAVRVAVRAATTAEGSTAVQFTVEDRGPGIPPARRSEVFRPPFQVGEAGAARSGGLGLAIAGKIVELHRGRIWIDDAPEGGSAVHVLLPAG